MLSEDNGVVQTTQYQSKGENMNKENTYHIITRRLAFALLEIRLAFWTAKETITCQQRGNDYSNMNK